MTCAQPTDVVKVRFQASVHLGSRSDRKYNGTMDAYRTIAREEGLRGLWKGRPGLPEAEYAWPGCRKTPLAAILPAKVPLQMPSACAGAPWGGAWTGPLLHPEAGSLASGRMF